MPDKVVKVAAVGSTTAAQESHKYMPGVRVAVRLIHSFTAMIA
jgi:hypothetical protein